MSYDLVFETGTKLDKKSFAKYFKSRRHYEVGNGQAIYQNEDTGVYFIFDAPEDGTVAFNLNFYRPHTFGLEAAIELEAFAKTTGAGSSDESDELGKSGSFDKRKFLHNWNHGNRFGYRAMLGDNGPIYTWPAKRIREVWVWNYTKPVQDEFKEGDVFVPGIFATAPKGQAISVAIWPHDCPILLPQVDAVLVPIDRNDEESDVAAVAWSELEPLIKSYQEKADGMPRYRLAMDPWPPQIDAFLGKKRKAMKSGQGVTIDSILDRELVEEARQDKGRS